MSNSVTVKFEGIQYRLCRNWNKLIPFSEFENKPVNYLEIGTFYGANVIDFVSFYGKNDSTMCYCIDPWIDYDDYCEYKGEQDKIYNGFIKNIDHIKNKVSIRRGYSNEQVPLFQDDFFDIIYIDGNHWPEYALEDAVLSFRKLKVNGYMVFDDYVPGNQFDTARGIDGFIKGYSRKIKILGIQDNQYFIQKIN